MEIKISKAYYVKHKYSDNIIAVKSFYSDESSLQCKYCVFSENNVCFNTDAEILCGVEFIFIKIDKVSLFIHRIIKYGIWKGK